jgi:hypothetical protein
LGFRTLVAEDGVSEEVRAKLIVHVHDVVEIGTLVVGRPVFDHNVNHIVEVVDERLFSVKAADVSPFRDQVKIIEDLTGGSGRHADECNMLTVKRRNEQR